MNIYESPQDREPFEVNGSCWCHVYQPSMTLAELANNGHCPECTRVREAWHVNDRKEKGDSITNASDYLKSFLAQDVYLDSSDGKFWFTLIRNDESTHPNYPVLHRITPNEVAILTTFALYVDAQYAGVDSFRTK